MKTDQEGVELPLGEGLLEHAQMVWIESCKNIRVSGLHRDVARVMTSMGLSHTIEQLTDDSLFSVDIALAGASSRGAGVLLLLDVNVFAWHVAQADLQQAFVLFCCRAQRCS